MRSNWGRGPKVGQQTFNLSVSVRFRAPPLEPALSLRPAPLPGRQELLDVAALVCREREAVDEPPRLLGVVVLDRGFEVLTDRRRLGELAAQPAEQAHLRGFHATSLAREAP
jgi:hypothetical protein